MMRASPCATLCAALALLCLPAPLVAAEDPVAEAVLDYLDFATPAEGIILPQQLTKDIFSEVVFIDTRSAEAHAAGTIPGARQIEWRAFPGQLDDVPQVGMVVLFCDTGILSAQAMFAARLLGRDNVRVLQGGYASWLQNGAFHPE